MPYLGTCLKAVQGEAGVNHAWCDALLVAFHCEAASRGAGGSSWPLGMAGCCVLQAPGAREAAHAAGVGAVGALSATGLS